MSHRGPDDEGIWWDAAAQVGLGHRRLSIIDLSEAGHQPMENEDGTVRIVFNGEIYDYQEYRGWLIARGHRFRSTTDTEVLIHLYEEMGLEFLQKLNGMFALAIWDARRGQLVLARDHAGIKPLYYREQAGQLWFASEMKALLTLPEASRELNLRAIADYLTFLWVPGEETLMEEARKVEPGQYVVWRNGTIQKGLWFTLKYEPDRSVSEAQWIERTRETLGRAVRRQMVADVPLGAFLSGGTDSSAIVACMRQAYPDREIKCYTARIRKADMCVDKFVDDYPYAERVAKLLQVDLKSFTLKPDIVALLSKMVYHLDEPDADPAVFPTYLISNFARADGVTVLLSGTGGDEVFFGYRSHQAYRAYEKLDRLPGYLKSLLLAGGPAVRRLCGAQNPLTRRWEKFHRALCAQGLARHLSIVDWSSPTTRRSLYSEELRRRCPHLDEAPACMERYYSQFSGQGELNRHSHLLIQTFLAAHNFLYADKSSMAASIEVRVPYLDLEVMRLCARMPESVKLRGCVTKAVLKSAMSEAIPRNILYRSKTGFGAPLRKWIRHDLDELINELLSPRQVAERGLFNPAVVQQILRENRANRVDHAYLIYALLVLEIWLRTFYDKPIAGSPFLAEEPCPAGIREPAPAA